MKEINEIITDENTPAISNGENIEITPLIDEIPEIEPENATTAPASLPVGYLADGYYAVTQKGASYRRPEYVDTYARQIAVLLATMKPSDFNPMLREMKRSNKGTLPFEARKTAAFELLPSSLALVRRKKAPQFLINFIKANLDAIKTDADWMAFFKHIQAVQGYMFER